MAAMALPGLSAECHTPRVRWGQAGSPWPVASVAPPDAAAVPGHGCWSAAGSVTAVAPEGASVGVHVGPARPCGPMPASLLAAGVQDVPPVPGSSGMLSARRHVTAWSTEQQQQQQQQSSFVPPNLQQPSMPAPWSPRGPQQQQQSATTEPAALPEVSVLVQGASADQWRRMCAGDGLPCTSAGSAVVHGSASVPVPAAATVNGAIRQTSVTAKVPPCVDEAPLLRATTQSPHQSWGCEKSDSSFAGSLAFKPGTIKSGVATPCRVRTMHAPTPTTSCRSQTPRQVNRMISCGTSVAPPSSPAPSAAKGIAPVAQQRVCPATPRGAVAPRALAQVAQTPVALTPRGGGATPLPGGAATPLLGGAATPLLGSTPRGTGRGLSVGLTMSHGWATATVPPPGTATPYVVPPPAPASSRATSDTSRAPSVSRGVAVVCNAAAPQENVPSNAGAAGSVSLNGGSAVAHCEEPLVPAEPGVCCYLARLQTAQDDLARSSFEEAGERLYDEDWWYWHLEERRRGGAPPDSMFATATSAGPMRPPLDACSTEVQIPAHGDRRTFAV
mmetsp:Transcript_11670/g.22605  ORF Transcript_11670/g.22605 Transcript_11670/m.22605 type:complete len:558 (-) Transcript_11670:55-1728(-)